MMGYMENALSANVFMFFETLGLRSTMKQAVCPAVCRPNTLPRHASQDKNPALFAPALCEPALLC